MAAKAEAKNFYNLSLAHFADTGDGCVRYDNLPDFHKDPNVSIAGGPIRNDSGNITLYNPLTFRHKNSKTIYTLNANGRLSSNK